MEKNIEHQTEQKIEKFNFFKRFEFSGQTKTEFFFAVLKTILAPINYFVIFPVCFYLLAKSTAPEASLNIANEIFKIPTYKTIPLLLLTFCIITAVNLFKDTFNTSKNAKKLGKQFTSIWLPFAKSLEIVVLIYLVPVLWSVLWPLIK